MNLLKKEICSLRTKQETFPTASSHESNQRTIALERTVVKTAGRGGCKIDFTGTKSSP